MVPTASGISRSLKKRLGEYRFYLIESISSPVSRSRTGNNDKGGRAEAGISIAIFKHGSGVFGLLNASLRRVFPAYLILLLWNTALSMSITGPVLPLYIEALGIGIVGWSALAATFAVGMFLFELVWGV